MERARKATLLLGSIIITPPPLSSLPSRLYKFIAKVRLLLFKKRLQVVNVRFQLQDSPNERLPSIHLIQVLKKLIDCWNLKKRRKSNRFNILLIE